jgi:hypothetical protein
MPSLKAVQLWVTDFQWSRNGSGFNPLWAGVATVAFLACVPWVKKLMGEVK